MKRTLLLVIIGILIIVGILILVVYCLNPEVVLVDSSTAYYVANDGDNTNDGLSPVTPWQTIGKVNTELNDGVINVGDDIYFNRGDTFTNAELQLRVGGNSSNWMIFGAYGSGANPILSNSPEGNGIDCKAGNIGYIKIQDLDIRDQMMNGIRIKQANLTNIIIYNVDIDNSNNNGIVFYQIDTYKIENCTVTNSGNGGIGILGSPSYKICNGQIRNCTSSNVRANDGFAIHNSGGGHEVGPNHLLINCKGWNCNEQAFDITSGENIYLKDCEGYSNGNCAFVLGHDVDNVTIDNFHSHDEEYVGAGITNAQNVIIRNSRIYGSDYYLFNMYGQSESDKSENLYFYNNDIVWNSASNDVTLAFFIMNLTFKNNIFFSTQDAYPDNFIKIAQGGNTSNRNMNWSYNLWWRGDGGDGDDDWWYIDSPASSLDFAEWTALDNVYNEIRADPKLENPSNENFNLQIDSPAIDAGGFLTNTISSGSGTQIKLDDAGYFCDGFGLTNGDNIVVGSNIVTVIDVNYGADIITVNKSISWNEGDTVTLVYSGSAPDIGAYEFVSILS